MTDRKDTTTITKRKMPKPAPAEKKEPLQQKRRGRPPKVSKNDKREAVKIGVPVDKRTWLRLRALAIREDELTGELLDQAIKNYLDKHE
jgi:hypothetical protein